MGKNKSKIKKFIAKLATVPTPFPAPEPPRIYPPTHYSSSNRVPSLEDKSHDVENNVSRNLISSLLKSKSKKRKCKEDKPDTLLEMDDYCAEGLSVVLNSQGKMVENIDSSFRKRKRVSRIK